MPPTIRSFTQRAAQTQTSLAELNSYTTVANNASLQVAQNNASMTSLHQVLARATELGTGVSSTMSTANMQNVGTEMNALLSQITSIANQTDSSGNYIFGGTSNVAPVNSSTQAYNAGTNGQTTSVDVQQGFPVQTSIVAGRSGSPAVDGFLYDSATGVDVLASIKQAVADLNSGNLSAFQTTDLPGLNKALDHVSSYVGSTAANMAAVQNASDSLKSQIAANTNNLNTLTQTNLPTATLQLQQIQTQYQAHCKAVAGFSASPSSTTCPPPKLL